MTALTGASDKGFGNLRSDSVEFRVPNALISESLLKIVFFLRLLRKLFEKTFGFIEI